MRRTELLHEEEPELRSSEEAMEHEITPSAEADALFDGPQAMLEEVRGVLSPLMREALSIKLAREREELERILLEESREEAERQRRQGVLDRQYFRKRPLPPAA